MIRFTWMQARTQTVAVIAGLAIIAVVAAVTGPHLMHLFDATAAACKPEGNCPAALTAFLKNDRALRIGLDALVVVMPAVIGLFWGAPLVAGELEAGTFRLAWTQSVTRTRWLAVKLGVVGLISMGVTGLLSLMVTWWSSPADQASLNQFASFDYHDIVPVGYAAFAFALGVTAGVLIRWTLPAMAVALAAFVFGRLATTHWIRPHLLGPAHRELALNPHATGYGYQGFMLLGSHSDTLQPSPPSIPNAWITSIQIVDNHGHGITSRFLASACPGLGQGGPGGGTHSHREAPASVQQALQDCVAKVGRTFHEVVIYQPASRYWALQWYELAIYLGAAVVLGGFCLWWVRRRIT